MLIAALTLALRQESDVVPRWAAWAAATPAFSASLVVTPPSGIVVTAEFMVARNASQSYIASWADGREELRQSEAGVLYLLMDGTSYVEYDALPMLAGPPPEAAPPAAAAYPAMLLAADPTEIVNAKGWASKGQEAIDGVPCDVIEGSTQPGPQAGAVVQEWSIFKVWLGPMGEPKQFARTDTDGPRRHVTTWRITSMARVPVESIAVSLAPPEGRVPEHATSNRDGIDLGTRPRLTVIEPNTGESLLLAAKPRLVIFTTPGSEPCRLGRPLWTALGKRARREGLELLEVIVSDESGAAGVTDWPKGWDRNAATSSREGIEGTPYLVVFDVRGVATRAWSGYAEGEDAAVTAALFKP